MRILDLLNQSPILAVVFLLSIILAITVHEFAHAWTADRLGDDTPASQGRVTLNPFAHLDPLGSILFLFTGFGWGKPVMYDPRNLNGKADELKVALAGPASNLILALFLKALVLAQLLVGVTLINPIFLGVAITINLYLAAFNMIPIPPLDGSSVISYFWPEYRTLVSGQASFIILIALVFLPVGNTTLLSLLVTPILTGFDILTSLFGILPLLLS
ncbi:site-2 protease family protein [soil metagenome]